MPYQDENGQTRYSAKEQYWHNKKIADSGKAPERILRDGTKLPAKNLTTTEKVRYANKAEAALKRLNDYQNNKSQGQPVTQPKPVTKPKAETKPATKKKTAA